MVNGRLDPQKNAFAGNVPDLDALALQRLEYDFRYWQLLRRGHEVIPELTNGVFLDLLQTRRDHDPARVVFSVEPFLDVDDSLTGLRLRHDRAYWVSNVIVRGTDFVRGDKGTVDVTTRARPDRVRVAHPYAIVSGNAREPRDLMGPNPNASGFDEWDEQGIRIETGPPQSVENGFEATFTRVAAVTLDLARMGLAVDRELTATIVGDGPTELSLAGPWRGPVDVRVGAACRPVDPVAGVVTVTHEFGSQSACLTVSPVSG
jgi:hypothetical protein